MLLMALLLLLGLAFPQGTVFHLMGTYAILDLPYGEEYRAYSYLRELEEKLSDYMETSEISEINKKAGKAWVKVSPETYEVLNKALEISRLTNGAFDITVGALTIRARRLKQITEEEARRLIDYRRLLLKDGKVMLELENMAVDLGGIGKCYALQKAYERLNLPWGFMAIAGDMKVWGHNRLLGVYDPKNKSVFMEGYNAKDLCLSSSGNYLRKHILGKPTDVLQITVVHEDCTYADALSTALFAMGEEDMWNFINQYKLGVLILFEDGTYYVNDKFLSYFKTYTLSPSWKERKAMW